MSLKLQTEKVVINVFSLSLSSEIRLGGGGWQEKASLVVKNCRYKVVKTSLYRVLCLIFVQLRSLPNGSGFQRVTKQMFRSLLM